ncbi:unnamed protein product [Peronospora belbahrii]|uniref:PH domain-containing protein n=2 Tax=Peronospora belbahrii TaxID=622444 RepID=A0AAU9KHJ8_9STRA|nr:unnamed protein product [Peronospora belbahrii]
MKSLAYRLRGCRTSRRDDEDDVERSFRFEETVKNENSSKRSRVERSGGKAGTDDNWRKNRDINKKTGSCCKTLGTLATQSCADDEPPSIINSFNSLPLSEQHKFKSKRRTASAPIMARTQSPQQQRMMARAHSSSKVNSDSKAAVTLRSNNGPTDDQRIGRTDLSSSSSVGRTVGRNVGRSRDESSMCSSSVFSSASSQKPEVAVDVRYSGILMIKRGLLKVACKRYYFVACSNPELYSCKDETSFNLWLASGHPLGGGDAVARASGLIPVLMGTVLRADAPSEDGGSNGGCHLEKTLHVMIGSSSKCFTLRFTAESSRKATQWLKALQEVQITKRNGTEHSSKSGYGADTRLLLPLDEHNALCGADSVQASDKSAIEQSENDIESMSGEAIDSDDREPVVMRPAPTSDAKLLCAYPGSKLQCKTLSVDDDDGTAVPTPTSHSGRSPTSAMSEHGSHPVCAKTATTSPASAQSPISRFHRIDSVSSCSSTASGQSQGSTNGKVLLFVPVAGSSLTASASRMEKAQKELDALIANGAKLPSRVMKELVNGEPIAWRYGAPEYVLTDLAYVKGRMRESGTTPLASYVEERCQTFIMEATHKARYDQWQSVCQETFYLQVNDEARVPGGSIFENDMLGLLYLGNVIKASVSADYEDRNESQDPRAELAEAFPDGFPMEVLDVFTEPPRCYFSWRQWGLFTGKYRGVKGDGSKVEIRGFAEMMLDASRIRSLRLFFRQRDLFDGLQQATDRVIPTRGRRESAATSFLSSTDAVSGRATRTASITVAPVMYNGSTPNSKTSDIIESLANFTLRQKSITGSRHDE